MSQYIIQTRDLTKTYGEQKSVSNLNMHVRKGKIYGLLGRNGAGKTTTMKMLLNLIEPTSGSIRIFNRDIRLEEKKILPRIGSLIESPGFYPNLTGTENLRIFAKLRGIPRTDAIEQALKLVNLPYKDKKLYSQYSLGMKQRLGIARAILSKPELLILDEPTNGLDPAGMKQIRDLLKMLCTEYGITIVVSSHILSEIESIADTVGVINHGVLMKEVTMKEISEMSLAYIELNVINTKKASYVLADKMGLDNFKIVEDGKIRIYDHHVSTQELSKVLALNDVEIVAIGKKAESLEDYFLKMTAEV